MRRLKFIFGVEWLRVYLFEQMRNFCSEFSSVGLMAHFEVQKGFTHETTLKMALAPMPQKRKQLKKLVSFVALVRATASSTNEAVYS